ncbi:MAG: hypothetical protein WAU86_08285 [Oricola sp.]
MQGALHCDIAAVSDIDARLRSAMFALYDRYYSGAARLAFERDLAEKSQVVLLRNGEGALCGFSTVRTWTLDGGEESVRIVYSGDTVIDRAYWGTQALSFHWIENAGAIKASVPETPLYWLLITKGHRTYRYMSAFARDFYPTWRRETPAAMKRLMDTAGRTAFGDRYDQSAGIVRHEPGGAALRGDYAGLDPHRLANREVAFFLECNPGYAAGDELLCICELSETNLRPMARTQFLRGYDGTKLATAALRREA